MKSHLFTLVLFSLAVELISAEPLSGFSPEKHTSYDASMSAPAVLAPQWNHVGSGIAGTIITMEVHQGNLYVGGDFTNGAGIPDADYIARWDGCEWHAVVAGLNGPVNAIAFNGSKLYAGGSFTGHIGKLEGGTWTILPGIEEDIISLGANSSGVYAGGNFTDAGGNPNADGIARWNGTNWEAMGSGIGFNDAWLSIATIGNDVFVGGTFYGLPGNEDINSLAKWNGTSWSSLGGFTGFVTTIRALGADLYVGGTFDNAGGNPNADDIARWDGSIWHNVGTNGYFSDYVSTMTVSSDFIYATYQCWNGCEEYAIRRFDLQAGTWDDYPPLVYIPRTMIQFEGDLYIGDWSCCGHITTRRWGEPNPEINITGVPGEICKDASPISLPATQSGITGYWTGNGVSNNIFNPANQNGDVTLIFHPNPGQCASAVDFIINVYLIYINLTLPPSICGASEPINLVPFQSGYTGNWSGPGVSNNYFDPEGINGMIFLTFTPTPGQCGAVSSDYTNVFPPIVPDLSDIPGEICENSNPLSLPTHLDDIIGNWSGQGVVNNIFDPSGLSGEVILTFTPTTNFCAETVSTDIFVDPYVSIDISGIPDSVCQLSSPLALPVIQSGIQGNWSGTGVNNNTFNPSGLNGSIPLTFTPVAGACADPASTAVFVDLNIPVITGVPDSICQSINPFVLPVVQSDITGNWSGEGVTNNSFDPEGLDGVITLTFTPIAGQCAIEAIHMITVDPEIIPQINGLPSSICVLSPPIELPDIQNGIAGEWSGAGVQNNYFNPQELTGVTILLFTPDDDQCAGSNSFVIDVLELSQFTPSGIPAFICEDAAPQSLPVVQSGITGDWSGTGVTNNFFDPHGLHGQIQLTFTPLTIGCFSFAPWMVTVDTSFIPVITDLPSSLCHSDAVVQLSSTQGGFTGVWSGPGVSNNTFLPSALSGIVPVSFIPDSNQCAVNVDTFIIVDTLVQPVLSTLPDVICQNDDPLELSPVQGGITGTWIGPGIDSNLLIPDSLEGNIMLSFISFNGACEDTAIATIKITGVPNITNLTITCDSVSGTFTVSFAIVGGDSTGYLVDGLPVDSNQFISAPIPFSQSHFAFALEDGHDCAPVAIMGANPCSCFSDAGTMILDSLPLEICQLGRAKVEHHGDAFLDPNDVLVYILHDHPGSSLGTIYGIATDPVFYFLPGMILGQTYYISALVATTDGNGMIDLTDPCLSVSPGVPVLFKTCSPDETNDEPVPYDGNDRSFSAAGENVFAEPEDLWIPEGMHVQNPNIGIGIYQNTAAAWSDALNDPQAIVREFSIYDFLGRLHYRQINFHVSDFLLVLNDFIAETGNVSGFYVFSAKAEKGNGDIVSVQGGIALPR
jgi:hypothetical protein